MKNYSRSLDEQIRRAIADGEFDHLPGKGKPLNLDHNPHEDPGWRIAYHMLRSSGYTLPWIETRQEIEAELEGALTSLERSWKWRRSALDQNLTYEIVESEWQHASNSFNEKIDELNKRIDDYNLEVPSSQFKRQKIKLEREIKKITSMVD